MTNIEHHHFSDNAGVGIGVDEYDGDKSYYIYISTQGKTVEYPISKTVYNEMNDEFEDISEP